MRSPLLVLLVALCAVSLPTAAADDTDFELNDWLLRAEGEDARMRLLQEDLAGFSRAMWEVGERWQRIHQALLDGNLKLAAHHHEESGEAIQNGMVRRPARAANSRRLLLDEVWPAFGRALDSGDAASAWKAFEDARSACMACHIAEDMGFLNDQPMFRDLRAPGTQ